MADVDVDVVILGAGLAGMTAAYELRDRSVVVLESRSRVGGRTKSLGDDDAWINVGAQIITSPRMKQLCQALGLDLLSMDGADFGLIAKSRFSRGSSAEMLFVKLKLGLREKIDFARTVLRLQRLLARIPSMSADERTALDRKTLRELLTSSSPTTVEILNGFCEEATGASVDHVSALIGLSYSLGAYLDANARKEMYAIRGGTQQVCLAIARALPEGTLRHGATVTSVRTVDGIAEVDYTADGSTSTIRARQVICALPAPVVLDVVEDLPPDVATALEQRSPYSLLITVSIPVRDGTTTPWDGVFFMPAPGSSARFGLITNYGYPARMLDRRRGGYLAILANGPKGAAISHLTDEVIISQFVEDLVRLFPGCDALIDVPGAVVQRWDPVGLPPMRPGSSLTRGALRHPVGAVRLCGDYTAEPGLGGANNSGYYVAKTVRELLDAR